MLALWLEFVLILAVIVFAGTRLSKYGDILGEKLGLTGSWVGLVLLAAVTSLPELFAGISASAIVRQPDLAVGNLLGANVMNMVGVALVSTIYPGSISSRAGKVQALSAALGMAAVALAGIGIFVSRELLPLRLFDVGVFSIVVFAFYLAAQRIIYHHEKSEAAQAEERKHLRQRTSTVTAKFAVAAVLIIAAGLFLPRVAEGIASGMGWGRSFVGSILMSFATTTPELVVSVSALRLGLPGMALGNFFGSTVFNMALLFIDDVFYAGSLLADASQAHLFTVLLCLCMMAASLTGLLAPRTKKGLRVIGWDAAIVVALYVLGVIVLFKLGVGAG